MAVYPPEHERRLRLHLPAFKEATNEHSHPWGAHRHHHVVRDVDGGARVPRCVLRGSRAARDGAPGFFDHLVAEVRSQLATPLEPDGVVALLGAGTLFGLGDAVKVSALLNAVNDAIAGRLLVFFPGEHRGQQLSGCSTRATAGTTWPFRSHRTGAVDDDHEPRAVLPGSRPRRRSRTTASPRSCGPRPSSSGTCCAGSCSSFVCEGQYARGLEQILNSFLTNLSQAQQPAAWVSGFYGSGKSHLVRVLEYLWRDVELPGGERARDLVTLPDEVRDHLTELSTAGKRLGGLWSAAGTLASGKSDAVRLAFLSVLFESAGLPEEYARARFTIWARKNGYLDAVRAAVEAEGRTSTRRSTTSTCRQ